MFFFTEHFLIFNLTSWIPAPLNQSMIILLYCFSWKKRFSSRKHMLIWFCCRFKFTMNRINKLLRDLKKKYIFIYASFKNYRFCPCKKYQYYFVVFNFSNWIIRTTSQTAKFEQTCINHRRQLILLKPILNLNYI